MTGERWEHVIVMVSPGDDGWHALWESSESAVPLGSYEGTRAGAIAYARECYPRNVLIFDEDLRDLVPLAESDR